MDQHAWLADRFEEQRGHLRAVAYRMLGSLPEADDAVQDAWLRASRAGTDDVDNLGGWLTTIVARVCLNRLRSRARRPEEPLETGLPDPVVTSVDSMDPEQEALLADSVGLALLVVLDTLGPAERLAFVLHDTFDLPFDEIAPIVGRTPEAARQLASRARRRVRGAAILEPDHDADRNREDRHRQWEVVEAFIRAARAGDFDALIKVLDPDVVLRGDFGRGRPLQVLHGASAVAQQANAYRRVATVAEVRRARINGLPGGVVVIDGQPFALMAFTIRDDRIVEIDAIQDSARIARVAAEVLDRASRA
jgi:RNA polymerase sigma factor (sigma-70 family)